MNKKIILAIGILLLLSIGIAYLLSSSFNIYNKATIKTIGLESDTTSIDWGMLTPGENKSITINLKNIGNIPVMLTYNTSNWNPSNASQYISLTWNYSNTPLQPDIWYPIELTIHVSPNIIGIETFTFDLIIIASETI